jgi:hypothetical protein
MEQRTKHIVYLCIDIFLFIIGIIILLIISIIGGICIMLASAAGIIRESIWLAKDKKQTANNEDQQVVINLSQPKDTTEEGFTRYCIYCGNRKTGMYCSRCGRS